MGLAIDITLYDPRPGSDTCLSRTTTSSADEDKVQAYNLGVAGYILKSNSANGFMEATALLDTYWRVVEFPAT
jgi:hypothetical protein